MTTTNEARRLGEHIKQYEHANPTFAALVEQLVTLAEQAPGGEPIPEFDDPRVKAVYDLLCDDTPAPKGEHWEGFLARRIVAALTSPAKVEPRSNPNAGHGHVFPRPDGVKARCGGPAICKVCALDAARAAAPRAGEGKE